LTSQSKSKRGRRTRSQPIDNEEPNLNLTEQLSSLSRQVNENASTIAELRSVPSVLAQLVDKMNSYNSNDVEEIGHGEMSQEDDTSNFNELFNPSGNKQNIIKNKISTKYYKNVKYACAKSYKAILYIINTSIYNN